MYTTIQINKITREKLNRLKPYRKATYDEIIEALIDLVPDGDEEGKYTSEFKASLLRGLLDIKHGRIHSHEEIKRIIGA